MISLKKLLVIMTLVSSFLFFLVMLWGMALPTDDIAISIGRNLVMVFAVSSVVTYLLCIIVVFMHTEDSLNYVVPACILLSFSALLIFAQGANGMTSNRYVRALVPLATINHDSYAIYDIDTQKEIEVNSQFVKILGQDIKAKHANEFVTLESVGYVNDACWDNHGVCRILNYISDYRRFVVEVRDFKTNEVLGNIILYRSELLMAQKIYEEKTGHHVGHIGEDVNTQQSLEVKKQVQSAHPL